MSILSNGFCLLAKTMFRLIIHGYVVQPMFCQGRVPYRKSVPHSMQGANEGRIVDIHGSQDQLLIHRLLCRQLLRHMCPVVETMGAGYEVNSFAMIMEALEVVVVLGIMEEQGIEASDFIEHFTWDEPAGGIDLPRGIFGCGAGCLICEIALVFGGAADSILPEVFIDGIAFAR